METARDGRVMQQYSLNVNMGDDDTVFFPAIVSADIVSTDYWTSQHNFHLYLHCSAPVTVVAFGLSSITARRHHVLTL